MTAAARRNRAMTPLLGWTAVLASLAQSPLHAESTLIFGNEPAANDSLFSAVATMGGNFSKAIGFTMDATTSYDLDTLSLRLKEQPGSNSTLTVSIFGGGANGPAGLPLVNLQATSAIPTVAGDVKFLSAGTKPFVFEAGSTYWIDVSGTSDTLNGIVWYASDPGIKPSGTVANAASARFGDSAASISALGPSTIWNSFALTGSPDVPPLGPPSTQTTPEPSAWIPGLTAVIAGGLFGLWRRTHSRRGA